MLAQRRRRAELRVPAESLCHPDEVFSPRPRRPENEGRFIFRPWSSIAASAFWVVCAGVWLVVAAESGWSTVLREAPTIALISTVVYAVFGRPRVIVSADEVLLRNVIRDVSIPYRAIGAVDTQYVLTVTTVDGRRHQAWAAPAGGRIRAARVTPDEQKALAWAGPLEEIPSSAALRSDAGAAALAIRRKWQALPGDDPADGPVDSSTQRNPARVEIRWATGVLLALAVSLVACVVAAVS
jgi:hypothetical protein